MTMNLNILYKDDILENKWFKREALIERIRDVLDKNFPLIDAFTWSYTKQGSSFWSVENMYQREGGHISPEARRILASAIRPYRRNLIEDPEYDDLFI